MATTRNRTTAVIVVAPKQFILWLDETVVGEAVGNMVGAKEDPFIGVGVANSVQLEGMSLLVPTMPAKEDDDDENGTLENSENWNNWYKLQKAPASTWEPVAARRLPNRDAS